MTPPKKKTRTRRYLANIRASVQLHGDGIHVALVIPWSKLERAGLDADHLRKKYSKKHTAS